MDHISMKIFFTILLLAAMFNAQNANAQAQPVYATPSIPGYASGLYKPALVPVTTANGFGATATVSVATKPIAFNTTIPWAANAPNYAKTAIYSNPAILFLSLLTWSSSAGLESDTVNWYVLEPATEPPPPEYDPTAWPTDINYRYGNPAKQPNPYFDTTYQACQDFARFWREEYGYREACDLQTQASHVTISGTGTATCYTSGPCAMTGTLPRQAKQECPSGYTGTPPSCTLAPVRREATMADFDALPAPPPDVLAGLAPEVGIPVDQPVTHPQVVPAGDPYLRADGWTVQPTAAISPAPNGQVAVDLAELPITDPEGNPVNDPVPEPTQLSQCEKFPNTLGCANLDQPTQEALQTEDRAISLISPVLLGGSGQCPAPLTASFLGQTVSMSFDPLCQFATTLRPLLLALAWLASGVIFIGGVRNG